jgi:hypothetical protein
MLSDTLNTNQIRNAASAEVEFQHREAIGRTRVFAQVGESFAYPHRLTIKHQESGSGIDTVRRSVTRVDKTIVSQVDPTRNVVISVYEVAVIPVGHLTSTTEAANVIAELGSFVNSTDGATMLHNGTGNGQVCLLNGSL